MEHEGGVSSLLCKNNIKDQPKNKAAFLCSQANSKSQCSDWSEDGLIDRKT